MATRLEFPEKASAIGSEAIQLRGVRVHNLRDLDVDIPRDQLVVLTGVSGSGKSSLAFDTIHAEGRRRYIEGLSSFARQFLDQLERPDVDLVAGLPPTVAIEQGSGSANPRSTVATITEAYDYLRLLYARCGVPHCSGCGQAIARQTPEQVVDGILALGEGRKVIVLAPMVRGRKGQHLETFRAIREARLMRARVDGEILEVDAEPPSLAKSKPHTIEAVVDRLVVREGIRSRIAESVDLALRLSDGTVVLSIQDGDRWDDRLASTRFACPGCGLAIDEVEPRTFSFNSPHGACPACGGLGSTRRFDPDLVAPDRTRSLDTGAIAAWPALPESSRNSAALESFLKTHRLDHVTPLEQWTPENLTMLFQGDRHGFPGLIPELEKAQAAARTEARKAAFEPYRTDVVCPACQGARLRPEARAIQIEGLGIHELTSMSVIAARAWLGGLVFDPSLERVGPPLVGEVASRLGFLERVGLGYLTLNRPADTLSGGELQRVRLATQVGSGLVGVAYVLDEPTAGLHPRDTERLLESLRDLRDRGNSVIIVEHDEATIRAADWVIDLGPGAGDQGGLIVAQGPPDALVEAGNSATARYLRGDLAMPGATGNRLARSPGWIEIEGAAEHNLQNVSARFPVSAMTCVTGVSGSGKSTLVLDVLARRVRRQLGLGGPVPGRHGDIKGLEAIDRLVVVDQAPIGRGPRSTPATFTGVFDEIRKVFTRTREAKARGYGSARFSFNVKGGRCEACQGQGVRRVAMSFLPDLFVRCEVCEGSRYNAATLEVMFKGKSIADVLRMRVEEAWALFEAIPKVARGLGSLREAGLGYVALGQSSATLSGGEAQRVKLASELGRVGAGKTLLILDEPTTGLHFADVASLLGVLHRLADLGNTLVVIEHNLDVVRAADWVVDLGPDGGDGGGQVVAQGTPAQIAEAAKSETGRWLRG